MKKIINGRKYDTETAKEIYYFDNGYCKVSDFKWYRETLYQKKTGEYFLHGEGNGLSPYKEYVPNCGYGRGEKIIPLSENGAKKWAEKNCDGDDYEDIFGEVEE